MTKFDFLYVAVRSADRLPTIGQYYFTFTCDEWDGLLIPQSLAVRDFNTATSLFETEDKYEGQPEYWLDVRENAAVCTEQEWLLLCGRADSGDREIGNPWVNGDWVDKY